jgi:hypothetical protein
VKGKETDLSVDWVRSSNDGATSVERGVDTGLGDRDGLLLHDLVNGDSIDVGHLVELVDADDTSIGEDHRSSFESPFAWDRDGIIVDGERGRNGGGIGEETKRSAMVG